MILSESYKSRLKKLAGIITEADAATAFSASNNRVPFDLDLMSQAIEQGREVGLLYKGDDMLASSGKYRIIYPVAMGISSAGNRVIRAIHKQGQSETAAKGSGVRSAEIKNVWRLFKENNIKGMWLTGNFFRGPLNGYNPNDKGMTTVEISADLSKIKQFQDDLLRQQQDSGERQSKLNRFKERGERPVEQPIENPDTRIGSEPEQIVEPEQPEQDSSGPDYSEFG